MVGRSILIVDDEAPIREMIAVALEMAGYDCLEAENSQQAHAIIVDRKPDLILLDWMLPGTSGIELARRLKRDELTGDIPIIMLTAKGEEDNKIQGLEVGADDYITKPFAMDELLARLRALTRRTTPTPDQPSETFGGIRIDFVAKSVVREPDEAIRLTPTEWRILEILVRNPGRLVTREDILTRIWGPAHTTDGGYLRLYVSQLRKKLEAVPAQPRYLQTVQGMGYRFVPDEPSS